MKVEHTLHKLFEKHLNLGFFTHVFAECGRIDQKEPSYREAVLPNGRDVFDLSSLTKALVTTPLVFRDCLRLGLSLDAKVRDWLESSEFSSPAAKTFPAALGSLTVRNLLRHEAGLPFWQNFYVQCEDVATQTCFRQDMIEGLAKGATRLPNTGKSVYSDPGFLLLGHCLEMTNAKRLGQLFGVFLDGVDQSRFPLGYPENINLIHGKVNPTHLGSRAIPTGLCAVRGRALCGEVHDENCWALGGVTGHAGIFASGEALSRYLKKLVSDPVGRVVFSENLGALKPGPNEALLGWRQGADLSSETFGEGQAVGHMGFTGVAFWITKDGKYSILLTNRVSSGRTSSLTRPFRREAFSALWDLCTQV